MGEKKGQKMKVLVLNCGSSSVKFAVIDRYVHESLGDKVSLTLKLQFQSMDKTFEEEEIASMVEALLSKIQEKFGITIR